VSFGVEGQSILVTGGRGFIGGTVVSQLQAAGAVVSAPSRQDLDVCEADAVWSWVDTHQPAAIVHLAGVVGGRAWLAANDARIDTDTHRMTNAIARAAKHECVVRVLGVGSTAAYADDARRPLRESSLHDGAIPGTIGAYARHKRELGMALAAMSTASGGYVLPCNVYGPGQRTDAQRANVVGAVVARFVDAVADGACVVHCHGANASREFLFVDDCAAGIIDALRRLTTAQPVNLGSGTAVPIAELTQCIAAAAGYEGRIAWKDKDAAGDALWSSDELARSQLAWRPDTALQDGIAQTVQWYRTRRCAS